MADATRVIEGVAGAAIVATVLSDVFRSVILPRASGRTLRLGPGIGAVLLRSWLAWARRKSGRLHTLGAVGPLLVVAEMLIWTGLLIAGYALLLHATAGLKPDPGFGDALYAAASAFVTTGLSGQEAATGPARTVIAAAGFSGLAVVTLVATFLISIQAALLRREALVLRLRARIGPDPSGVGLLETLARLGPDSDKALPAYFGLWEEWAAEVLLTHRAFPILVYFRSTDEDCGWIAALGAVLDAAALVAAMGHEDAGEHALVCHRMGARLIADLARQFGLTARLTPGLDRPQFDTALTRLEAAGYQVSQPPDLVWTAFVRLRSEHVPPLGAMAERFGEKTPGLVTSASGNHRLREAMESPERKRRATCRPTTSTRRRWTSPNKRSRPSMTATRSRPTS